MLGGRFGVWSVLHLPGMDRVKGPGPSCETLDCKTRSNRRAGKQSLGRISPTVPGMTNMKQGPSDDAPVLFKETQSGLQASPISLGEYHSNSSMVYTLSYSIHPSNSGHPRAPGGAQVTELEGLFEGLRSDVDALFMQAPSVDQGALCQRCEEMHQHVDEQVSGGRLSDISINGWRGFRVKTQGIEAKLAARAVMDRGIVCFSSEGHHHMIERTRLGHLFGEC